ncbi:MAG: hypothetical protein UZ12_BCD005003361 [Bacteroidetes bacterium OLB12]|nr:MAG: hypothetical protein UZ12_BCD005003361 [Bacteroidetes bacterium OLB12]HNU41705.1 hypothetical protein [Cyclobacteriaceae bacterium]
MENSIDLKALWNKQPVPQPDKEALLKKLDKLKAQKRRGFIIANVSLIATSAFIGWIWFYYQPQYITTKVGIVLAILAMLIYLVVYNKLIPLYNTLNAGQLNRAFLDNLLQIRQREQFMQTTITNLYFVMLSLGMGLYMYEYTSRMEFTWAIVAYAVTAGWVAFNWFYFRPRHINKNRQKLDGIIQQLQEIKNQLEE